ncbi:hypothetical protein ACJJTC_016080 [Scirpophaga incertulas]
MEPGFSRGQSNNLPKVDLLMVADYFTNHAKYISAQIQGQKLAKSGRDSYGDNAVGYVQVKTENGICTVMARITPEHRVRATAYRCTFVCNEISNKIESVECEGCAASRGGCKHTMALVMWLHRRSEQPACTEIACYWIKPKLSQIGSQLKFIKAKDMGSKKNRFSATSTPSCLDSSNTSFLQSVIEKSTELGIDSQIMGYFRPTEDIQKSSIHYLIRQFIKKDGVKDADSFMSFCKDNMRSQHCNAIEQATRSQADCRLWYEMRYARITASKAHESAQCSTPDGVLVEYLLGAYKFKETFAVKRGKW